MSEISEELVRFLKYVESGQCDSDDESDDLVKRFHNAVESIVKRRIVRGANGTL